jgi:hypothetical protein
MRLQYSKESTICDVLSHRQNRNSEGVLRTVNYTYTDISNGVVYSLLSLLTVYLQNLINNY